MSKYAELLLAEDDLIADVRDTLLDTVGVCPGSADALREMLREREDLVFDVAKFGASDTEIRGRLGDLVAHVLSLAPRWPTYGDGVDMDAFSADVIEHARSAGWTVAPWQTQP